MANMYSWAKAFNTETKTVKLNLPLVLGTSEADGTASAGMNYTAADTLVGRLIEVERATNIPKYVADLTAASTVSFDTSDLYIVSENVYAGNTFFIGYVINNKSQLGELTLRTHKDNIVDWYTSTINAPMQGRRN